MEHWWTDPDIARRRALLLLLPLLLCACASATPAPSAPNGAPADTARAAESPAPAEAPAVDEAAAAQVLLDEAVAGFGGAERVDGLRTLVVESTMTRAPESGRETTIRQRSYVAFPDRFRREAILEQMTVASAVGPAGAFVISPLGILPLPEEERAAMVRGFARTPLSLLRNRESEAFSAAVAGEGELDGQHVEYLEIVYDGDSHRLALDPKTGQVQEIRFATQRQEAAETGSEAGEVVIRYDDHREVDGLVYPFRSTMTSAGEPTVTRTVDSLQVDMELDPQLFEPPPAPPEGLLPPATPEAPPEAPQTPDAAAPPETTQASRAAAREAQP